MESSCNGSIVTCNTTTPITNVPERRLSFSPNTTPPSVALARNNLINLDAVALDKIFSFLGDEELRRFHQVNRGCKAALEARPVINKRRLELVSRIRENKENIRKKLDADNSINEVSPGTRINRDGIKPGTLLLVDCKNLLQNITTPTPTTTPSTDNRNDSSITPIYRFPFQIFEDVEKQLLSSGQLFVPWIKHRRVSSGDSTSPPTPITTGAKTTATRCRLISRMSEDNNISPTKLRVNVTVKTEPDFPFVAWKKSKSHSPLPSLVSPTWLSLDSPMEVPRSRSLGDMMPFNKVSNSKKSLRRIAKL